MKERWRLTVLGRRRELAALIENKLIQFERRSAKFAHTYPHRAVSEEMAVAVILAEKGEPHLLKPDKGRLERMAKVLSAVHVEFDRKNRWNDGYGSHDAAASYVADAISRAEITR